MEKSRITLKVLLNNRMDYTSNNWYGGYVLQAAADSEMVVMYFGSVIMYDA